MDKEFIPYEQALALKELGFDEPCFSRWFHSEPFGIVFYNTNYLEQINRTCKLNGKEVVFFYSSMLYQQAFRFFREKYNLDSFVKDLYKSTIKVGYYFGIDEYKGIEFQMDLDDYYETYEEAELECLKKLIEIVKNK